ncbi:MAG: BsuBI/PstI family type II restriction endonuclease [Vicinamibacterales bacterium]
MKLEDKVRQELDLLVKAGTPPVATTLQGVTKGRVKAILLRLDRAHPDIVDAVFALLDTTRGSWFSGAPAGSTFADGASTAHVGCHVGILQRDGTKLDREGRDQWIKPLRDIGAVEPVYLDATRNVFVDGHPVAKSPNSGYRLNPSFKAILQASEADWDGMLLTWMAEDVARERLRIQAEAAAAAKARVDTGHADLIAMCAESYAPMFLPGFRVLYVDDSDGDRISDEERARMAEAGINIELGDAMPDVLLWNPNTEVLWVIEAVTSDGEVDAHKVRRVNEMRQRLGKAGVGFTTAYRTWKDAAARQAREKNIEPGTYLWIAEDPSKHWQAEAFDQRQEPSSNER